MIDTRKLLVAYEYVSWVDNELSEWSRRKIVFSIRAHYKTSSSSAYKVDKLYYLSIDLQK